MIRAEMGHDRTLGQLMVMVNVDAEAPECGLVAFHTSQEEQ